MPNKTKIAGELASLVIELAKTKNARAISLEIGVARDTIKSFLNKNGVIPVMRVGGPRSDIKQVKVDHLKQILPTVKHLKEAQRITGANQTLAKQVAVEMGITRLLRTRKEASQDRRLTAEQIAARLYNTGAVYAGMNADGQYVVKNPDTGNTWAVSGCKMSQHGFARMPHITREMVEKRLASLGYTLVEVAVPHVRPGRAYYTAMCPKGHLRTTRLRNFGIQQCGSCNNNGTSQAELDLLELVRQYWPSAGKYKFQERITRPKEIDIYVPELKLGIEYCGLYSHSFADELRPDESDDVVEKSKHYKKMLLAQKEGIELITLFEDDWRDRNIQVWAYLKAKLGVFERKLHGRKCQVRDIDRQVGIDFMNNYHIQGSETGSFMYWGLFCGDELVSVMTFGRHPRGNGADGEIYLNRYAVLDGVQIRGGASKLFTVAAAQLRARGYKSVASWSDNCWSSGKIYLQLGFTLSPPTRANGQRMGLIDGSVWPEQYKVVKGRRMSPGQVKTLREKGVDMSCRTLYDCGKKRWVYRLG